MAAELVTSDQLNQPREQGHGTFFIFRNWASGW